MSYKVYLKNKEEKRILGGHPWVYANEVMRIEGEGKNGDLATVYTSTGKFVGKGFINHLSKILVRIFIRDESQDYSYDLLKNRIDCANEMRVKLGYKDNYRVVFAEADNLPALIIDKYADVFVVQLLSLGVDKIKTDVVNALVELFHPRGIYERSDVEVRKKEGLQPVKGVLYGDFDTNVVITENGVQMTVDVANGQKTGYFLDQKENRFALRRYCKNATVLDCFCNSGGFSLNAVVGGATSVTAVDISDKALEDVRQNSRQNGFDGVISTRQGNVFEVLREYKRQGESFDVVILDPPAFCKSASEVKDAYRGYKDINTLGLKLVKSGGFLVTASCSHYMTANLFDKMLREATRESGRQARIVEYKTQSPDHPASLAEEESTYLKFYVLNVQ